jgi:hypothetical protein
VVTDFDAFHLDRIISTDVLWWLLSKVQPYAPPICDQCVLKARRVDTVLDYDLH